MNSTTDSGRLSVREKFGYGLGDLASNFFWQMFAIFIAKFYTDVFMLGAATMGTMLPSTSPISTASLTGGKGGNNCGSHIAACLSVAVRALEFGTAIP